MCWWLVVRTSRARPLRAVAWGTASILVSGACGATSRDAASRADTIPAAVEERYKPETDEGLGASVAILLDNSGSMERSAAGDARPKYAVARDAIQAMLASTDSFVAKRPDVPINVGLYRFASAVVPLIRVRRYDRAALADALAAMPPPEGATAIGDAMDVARADLYRAGTFRKYLLVVTDGENTRGRSPRAVAEEIARRSEGAVRMYFVAFDVAADKFAFLRAVRGEVVGASNGDALRASLDHIYRGKILAESMDVGETLPDSGARRDDSAGAAARSSTVTPSPTAKKRAP